MSELSPITSPWRGEAMRRLRGYGRLLAGGYPVPAGIVRPPSGNGHSDLVGAWVARHEQALRDRPHVESVLRRLPNELRTVLFLRYVEERPWDEVAARLGVHRRQAVNLADQALAVVAWELGLFGEQTA